MKTTKKARSIIDGTSFVIAAELLFTVIEKRVRALDSLIEETEKADMHEDERQRDISNLETAQDELERLMGYLKNPDDEYQCYIPNTTIDEIKRSL